MAKEIRETRVAYPFSVDASQLTENPIVFEREGKPVAAVVPYEQFTAWREHEQAKTWQAEQASILERERAVFERLKPELLKTHADKWVAILDGKFVDSDDEEDTLVKRVYSKYGYRTIFVEQVTEVPHIYDFPSPEDMH
jgi:antitoxin (DNA-binding transcriptional repressor) of toxin-antitoxin stability system